jgi:Cys-rich protein (TIGR01571 family)
MSAPVAMAEPVKQQTVEVVAPSNLAGGYEFFVNAGNNVSYKVKVPEEGVTAGQRFHAVILSEGTAGGAHNVPTGRWRDGFCDCCAFGCCHPMCCLSFWCTACALGQVLHRNKLDMLGGPTSNGQAPGTSAFKIFFAITIVVIVGDIIISALIGGNSSSSTSSYNSETGQYESSAEANFNGGFLRGILSLFCFVVTMRMRSYIRGKYAIPGGCCEDCCCSFWCTPCTVCQISRHTADFNAHPAACCSDNGLNPGAPDVV